MLGFLNRVVFFMRIIESFAIFAFVTGSNMTAEERAWYGYDDSVYEFDSNSRRNYNRGWHAIEADVRAEFGYRGNVQRQLDDAKSRWVDHLKRKEETARTTTIAPAVHFTGF